MQLNLIKVYCTKIKLLCIGNYYNCTQWPIIIARILPKYIEESLIKNSDGHGLIRNSETNYPNLFAFKNI